MMKLKKSLLIFSASFATFIPFIPFVPFVPFSTFALVPNETDRTVKSIKQSSDQTVNQADQPSKSLILDSELTSAAPVVTPCFSEAALSVSDRSDADILSWAARKLKSAFSYNWVDYKEITDQAKIFFTTQGYQHYLKSLQDSGNTESVITRKLILQAKTTGPAKLLNEGTYQGVYSWQIEVPVVFTYYGVNDVVTKNVKILLLISRAPKLDFEEGIAISQLLLKPAD